MAKPKQKICGIVMPISECDGRPESHWIDVLDILRSTAVAAGFETRLVSDTFESNLIHKEILQNIYHDDIVICDVSGRNPNVFFELGIRMATQKPTVIVKDDETAYPFDTGPNRYVGYPRDLRHPKMEDFKKELSAMISKTSDQSAENSFIGQLGPFTVPDVESTTLPASEVILNRLDRIERQITKSETQSSRRQSNPGNFLNFASESMASSFKVSNLSEEEVRERIEKVLDFFPSHHLSVRIEHLGESTFRVIFSGASARSESFMKIAKQHLDT